MHRAESELPQNLVGAAESVLSWFDSPLRIALCAGIAGTLFATGRFFVAAHGNIAAFIVVGQDHVKIAQLPRGIPVRSVSGYDGQFYYRLAVDPLDWSSRAYGIKLDSFGRLERIGYPFLAWLTAGGQQAAVPVSLVVVNVAAFGTLAGICASLARRSGRQPIWGLLIAGYWGFLWTIARDLTELVAIVFALSAVLAIRKGHPVVAGSLLSAAVLSRETSMLLVGAIFLARLWTVLRVSTDHKTPARALSRDSGVATIVRPSTALRRVSIEDITWFLPLVVFAAWELVVLARTHHLPVRSSGGANLGVPLVGLLSGFRHYLTRLPSTASLLWFGELAILVVFVVLAALSLRDSSALLHERIAWAAYALLAMCLAKGIWNGDVGFRSLDELYAFSALLLMSSRLRLQIPALLTAAAWVTVAVELIRFI